MPEQEPPSYPTNWVSKNDLYLSRPDLQPQIDTLEDGDMIEIAKQIGDAVAETHDLTIDEILAAYLGISNVRPTDESPDVETRTPSIHSHIPETTRKTPDYNGWKGNGDSLTSARLTWLTFLWLTNDEEIDKDAYDLVNTRSDLSEAQTALKTFFEQTILGDSPAQPTPVDDLVRNIFKYDVNWAEIVQAYRD